MAKDVSIPDPAIILELVEAFRRSKVLFTAVSLGVFDALATAAKSAVALAAELHADSDALERLLDACVHLQLLSRHEDKYANTEAANYYLCRQSPTRITGYISYSNAMLWNLWTNLEDAVREGTHRWKQSFGWEGPIFSHFLRNEDAKREFLMGMHGYGIMSSPHVVSAFDLSRFRCLADVGGATGHLTIAACQRYPDLQGIVFDLPEAIPLAQEIVGASPVASRIRFVAGDFFTDPLPDADLFALGRILHDWTEAKIGRLLKRIFERLPSGGAILLAEKLLNEDKSGPRWAVLQSLNMLTCTEGKERTLSEYEVLLRHAGFTEVAGCRTNSPLDAVIAFKP